MADTPNRDIAADAPHGQDKRASRRHGHADGGTDRPPRQGPGKARTSAKAPRRGDRRRCSHSSSSGSSGSDEADEEPEAPRSGPPRGRAAAGRRRTEAPRRRSRTRSRDPPRTQRRRGGPPHPDPRNRRHHRQRSPSPSSSSSSSSSSPASSSSSSAAWRSAARIAVRAGAMAALATHGAPGAWIGTKGTRVATAALGAALVDTFIKHKYPKNANGVRHTAMRQAAEYAIGILVAEPLMQRAVERLGGRAERARTVEYRRTVEYGGKKRRA